MTIIGAYAGAGLGIAARLWANNLGKQHALARPWNYVGVILVGGFIGHNYNTWENNLLASVNLKRQEKGMEQITRDKVVNELKADLKF